MKEQRNYDKKDLKYGINYLLINSNELIKLS